jgi:predicted ribosomally synthesized peptide with nif11-like leader
MSKQALEAFKAKLSEDEKMRQELTSTLSADGSKATASLDELVTFAKSHGYDFTPGEAGQNLELNEDQLNSVSGGATADYYLKLDGSTQFQISSFSWGVLKY